MNRRELEAMRLRLRDRAAAETDENPVILAALWAAVMIGIIAVFSIV